MPRTWRRPIPPQPISAIGMRPDMISGSYGGQSAAIGERVRSDIEKRVVSLEKTLQLVDHEAEEARPTGSGDTGDVRTHEHVGQLANRTGGGNRLWVEHVDANADVPPSRTCNQRVRIHNRAARD